MDGFEYFRASDDSGNRSDHGVTILPSQHLTEIARQAKENWKAYKSQNLVKGRGRRSLGLAPQKLLSLSFDPIEAKVMLAEKYEAELAYHEAVREGLILNPSTGEPRKYSPQAHNLVMSAYDRCVNDLLRYGYARVPEKEDDIGAEIPPVSINLTLPSGGSEVVKVFNKPNEGEE